MRMSIRTKMLLNFAPLVIAFVVVFLIAYINLDKMHRDADKAALLIRESRTMARLATSASVLYEGVHDYLLSSDRENRRRFAVAKANVRADLRAATKLEILGLREKEIQRERRLLNKAEANITEAIAIGVKIMKLNMPADAPKGYDLMRQGDARILRARAALEKFDEIDQEELEGSLFRLHAVHGTVTVILIGFGVIALLSLISIVSIARGITEPIYRFAQGVKHISQGNLDYRLHITTGDEIQDLAETFNQMVFGLYQEERTAAEIQRRLLPKEKVPLPGVLLHAKQVQAKLVGGDWYDYYRIGNKLYLLIADASGKGMPGALVATIAMSAIRAEPKATASLEDLLRRANRTVENRLGGTDFVTAFIGNLDLDSRLLTFVNSGHEPPLRYSRAYGNWSVLQCDSGLPLGISNTEFKPHAQQISMLPGDKLLLYTDGIHDVRDPAGRFFNIELILKFLNEHKEMEIAPLMEALVSEALEFGGGVFLDDITLLGFEIQD